MMKKWIALLLSVTFCFSALSSLAEAPALPAEATVVTAEEAVPAEEPAPAEETAAARLVRAFTMEIPSVKAVGDFTLVIAEQDGETPFRELRLFYRGNMLMNLYMVNEPDKGYIRFGSDLAEGVWIAFDPSHLMDKLSALLGGVQEDIEAAEAADPEQAAETPEGEDDAVTDMGEGGIFAMLGPILQTVLGGDGDAAQNLCMLAAMLLDVDAENLYAAVKPLADRTALEMGEQGIRFGITVFNTDLVNITAALKPEEGRGSDEIRAIADVLNGLTGLLPEGSVTVNFNMDAAGSSMAELFLGDELIVRLTELVAEEPAAALAPVDPDKLFISGQLTPEKRAEMRDAVTSAGFNLAMNVLMNLPEEWINDLLGNLFSGAAE